MSEITMGKKWGALVLITFTHACLMGAINQTAGLGPQLVADLGISTQQLASVLTISFLTGAIFGIPFGLLADKTNLRWGVGIGLLLAAVGAWMRPFVDTYAMLYFANFIMGMGLAGLNSNSVKFLSAWWGARLTFAIGIYVMGAGLGISIALQVPRFFTSWNACYMVFAVAILAAAIAWLIFGVAPKGFKVAKDEIHVKDFIAVGKVPAVWIAALAMTFAMASGICVASLMTTVLVESKGLSMIDANNITTLNSLVNILGCIALPWIIDRFNNIRIAVLILSIVCAGCCLLGNFVGAWLIASTFFVIEGFFAGGVPGPTKASMGLIKDVVASPGTMGAAGGLQTCLQNLGAFFIPTFFVAGIAGTNYTLYWVLTAIVFLIGGVLLFCIPKSRLITTGKQGEEEVERLRQGESV